MVTVLIKPVKYLLSESESEPDNAVEAGRGNFGCFSTFLIGRGDFSFLIGGGFLSSVSESIERSIQLKFLNKGHFGSRVVFCPISRSSHEYRLILSIILNISM
jgi:hypothetical protein